MFIPLPNGDLASKLMLRVWFTPDPRFNTSPPPSRLVLDSVLLHGNLRALGPVFAFFTIVLGIPQSGRDRFRIKVTYMDIKIGIYQELGVYPLSVGLVFIISGDYHRDVRYYILVILSSITGLFFLGVMIALDGIAIFCIFLHDGDRAPAHCGVQSSINQEDKRLHQSSVWGGLQNVDFAKLRIMDKFCDESMNQRLATESHIRSRKSLSRYSRPGCPLSHGSRFAITRTPNFLFSFVMPSQKLYNTPSEKE